MLQDFIRKFFDLFINIIFICHINSIPGIKHTWDNTTGEIGGRYFNYYTSGAAVSEVEIDCLTGDHTVLQTDIVMDLGRSINPAVDIGQVNRSRDLNAFIKEYILCNCSNISYSSIYPTLVNVI